MALMGPKSVRVIPLRRWIDFLLQTILNLNRQAGTAPPLRVVQMKDWRQPFPIAGGVGIVSSQER